MKKTKFNVSIVIFSGLFASNSFAYNANFTEESNILKKMSGCYLVDYNYAETVSLMPGYVPDTRVYDVNKMRSVKEWITFEETGSNSIRLQHILFATEKTGEFMEGSLLKHQAEDWEYGGAFLYNFVEPNKWVAQILNSQAALWTRKITNLDDGLRYQCAATWDTSAEYPQWSCDNFAPIPGRETRDMGRSDYNTLERSTKLVVYGNSWLERQDNVKIRFSEGTKTPLVKETGKNWYVRVPDSECAVAQKYAQPKWAFWNLSRETWDEVLSTQETFVEMVPKNMPPRYVKMWDIEAKAEHLDLTNPEIRNSVKEEIKALINTYRKSENLINTFEWRN